MIIVFFFIKNFMYFEKDGIVIFFRRNQFKINIKHAMCIVKIKRNANEF